MQNQTMVTVQLGNYVWSNIPLYFITLAEFLVGLSISWLISTINEIGSALTIWNKEIEVKKLHSVVIDLKTRHRQFKLENARLRGDKREVQSDLAHERINHTKTRARSFFDRLRYRLS